MPDSHSHDHHHHHHSHTNYTGAFVIGTILNVGFVAIEFSFGFWTQSLSLLADAGHNLSFGPRLSCLNAQIKKLMTDTSTSSVQVTDN